MLQLNNSTPFAADMALFPDEQGIDTLYLIVKASFKIGQQWVLADKQVPPVEIDEYWGEPENSSLKYASDYHTGKPTTDILMVGSACPPNGEAVKQLDVSLSVGPVRKTIRVFGHREWLDGRVTEPQPFQTMPVVYERAFGGVHEVEGQVASLESRNPVGCGYAGKRSVEEMNGMPLPNLEDPDNLICQYTDQPQPSCFAPHSPNWLPRQAHAGTYDEAWQQQRAPYLPFDFNKQFFNMAHSDLVCPGYLRGGEAVHITNMHSAGDLQFNLPQINLVSRVSLDKGEQNPSFNLETLIIEPNDLNLRMVWRAAMKCDKKVLKINEINIALSR